MADGSGNGRVTVAGAVLGGLLLILVVVSLWLFTSDRYWFTEVASVHGVELDRLFTIILVVTGIAFVLVQGAMAYFVMRFGARGEEKAT